MIIKKLGIIGVGLIGGSLARALKRAGAVGEIVGHGRSVESLDRAVRLGVIDYGETSIARLLKDADVIVLAVPVGSMGGVLESMAPYLADGTVVTDVGSVKASVVSAARAALGAGFSRFVPGHPIAGTERSGVDASFPELFEGRRVVLTPAPETDPAALARVEAMWRATGADVRRMTVARHDEVLAATSHLPHVLAYALVDLLASGDDVRELFECAGGGFQDFTRIAASDPVMWRDICLANRDALVLLLTRYREELATLMRAIALGDGDELMQRFERAQRARNGLDDRS